MRSLSRLFLLGIASCLVCIPAVALGPIDGEAGAVWWANDFSQSGGVSPGSSDAGAPGFRAELWMKSFGFRAAKFSSELDELQDFQLGSRDSSDYTSLDLMWKAFSPTENNFLAVGVGWEQFDMGSIGLDGDTSGFRVSAEGRVGLAGAVFAYGQASLLPSLDDAPNVDPMYGRFENMDGMEYEVGVSWKAAPFVSVRAGYRENSVDFKQTDLDPFLGMGEAVSGSVESKGFLLGVGIHF